MKSKQEINVTWLIRRTERANAGVTSSVRLAVDKDGEQVYLTFTGTLRSGDRSPVTGIYSGNAITIQNYGNSMNEYVCFTQCDGKYLRLRR
ncbi:MAG TPA: hypothetical protein PK253_07300 [Spirochaetota bacterium]|nr:hypothetical protein [Spirochaetota bacterium]